MTPQCCNSESAEVFRMQKKPFIPTVTKRKHTACVAYAYSVSLSTWAKIRPTTEFTVICE